MNKINQLKKSAQASAIWRKHTMTKWKKDGGLFYSTCKVCGSIMWVIPNPATNEINICGSAIAVNCTTKVQND